MELYGLVSFIDEYTFNDLKAFRDLAVSITENAKGLSLMQALDTGFAKARSLDAAEKAIIFTESRRTQDYLLPILEDSRFSNQIVLFNGSNNDPKSRKLAKLEDKVSAQRQIKQLEQKRSDFRRKLFDAQDAIDQNKDGLLDDVEQRLQQTTRSDTLLTIRFTIL